MRVLFDTNVLIDVLLNRQPFVFHSTYAWDRVSRNEVTGIVTASALPTIAHLLKKRYRTEEIISALTELVAVFEIARVDGDVIAAALASMRAQSFTDLEDAVQHAAAEAAHAEAIVTRNARDFAGARLAAYTPDEFIARH